MRLILMLSGALLSACSVADLHLPGMVVASRQEAPSRGLKTDDGALSLPEEFLPVRKIAPVSFSAVPTCEAAALTLGEALGMAYTCDAGGQIALYYPGSSPRDLFSMFRAAVERNGGVVTFESGGVSVAGGKGETASLFGQTQGNSGAQPVPGVTAFTVALPPDNLESLEPFQGETNTILQFAKPPLGVSVDEVRRVASELSLQVRAFEVGSQTFVVYRSEYDRANIEALLAGVVSVSHFVHAQAAEPADLEAIAALYPSVQIVPLEGGLRVSGAPFDASEAVNAIVRAFPPLEDYRIDAAFLSFERGKDTEFAATLGLAYSRGLSFGQGSLSVGSVEGGGLSVALDAAKSRYSARVVSRPSLTVAAGDRGRFVSGQSVPVLSSIEGDNQNVQSFEYRDVGVVLSALPRLLPDGRIRIVLQFELSSLSDVAGVGGNPVVNTQTLETTVTASPGDLIVLSGLSFVESSRSGRASLISPRRSMSDQERTLQILLSVLPDA